MARKKLSNVGRPRYAYTAKHLNRLFASALPSPVLTWLNLRAVHLLLCRCKVSFCSHNYAINSFRIDLRRGAEEFHGYRLPTRSRHVSQGCPTNSGGQNSKRPTEPGDALHGPNRTAERHSLLSSPWSAPIEWSRWNVSSVLAAKLCLAGVLEPL